MTRPAAHALLTRLRLRAMRRALLSSYVLNGAAVALGMFLITALIHATLGPVASANASVGTIIALISDNPRACRGKFSHLIAAPILGVPLFLAVQLLREHPVELGLLLLPGTFLAMVLFCLNFIADGLRDAFDPNDR